MTTRRPAFLNPHGHCWPWAHDWKTSFVTPPAWDRHALGILMRCRRCPKVVAR